jgi:hypothetical protein
MLIRQIKALVHENDSLVRDLLGRDPLPLPCYVSEPPASVIHDKAIPIQQLIKLVKILIF